MSTAQAKFIAGPDGAIAKFVRAAPKSEPAPKRPKDRMAWLIKRDHIRADHADLGERILKMHEDRRREPSTHMHFDQGGGGGTKGGGVMGRVSAGQKWERLFAVVGPAGEAIVSCIIIDGKSLGDTAAELNLHPKAVLPMLQLSLDVLARS